MRRADRNLIFLAIAAVALAAGVCAQIHHERELLRTRRLTEINPATVQQVTVSCATCATRHFQRSADGWNMLKPFALPASTDAVARLIRVAQSPVHEWLSMKEYDLSRLGLDPAQITLTLDDTIIDVGNEDPIDHDRYMRVGNKLARVPDRFSARLLESPRSELADPAAAPAHD
ncbi:MAG TPA: DUF4340 domain-containing protein [Rudaea sp.]|nr:DUF4340 domain-containing protein [Rudaea sp.]